MPKPRGRIVNQLHPPHYTSPATLVVLCTEIEDVFDTIDSLSSRHQYLAQGSDAIPAWIYRGHESTDWCLLSSLHREILRPSDPDVRSAWEAVRDDCISKPEDAPPLLRHRFCEALTQMFIRRIVDYAFHSSRAGLLRGVAATEGGKLINSSLRWDTLKDYTLADFTAYCALIGLAQHHGIPTPFLDWSWNPYVALWFAASAAYERVRLRPGRFRAGKLAELWAVPRGMIDGNRVQLRLVTDQSFARAQDGVFTYDPRAIDEFERNGRVSTLDEIIEQGTLYLSNAQMGSRGSCPMPFRVQFPHEAAYGILVRLQSMGVATPTLKPSLTDIAKHVRLFR